MNSATRVAPPISFWKQLELGQAIRMNKPLMTVVLALTIIGWIMVTSASMDWAEKHFDNPFYISIRHGLYILVAACVCWFITCIPISLWRKLSGVMILIAVLLLAIVLIPGVGKEVNGSMRWLSLGIMNVQPSELAKIATVIYLAGYLDRRREEVQSSWFGFVKPLIVLAMLALLLLMEPDFGAVVVMMLTALSLLFLGGVRAGQFVLTALVVSGSSILLLVSQPYRLQRLIAYLDPWNPENVYNSGYQLTQSLIAFGRGEWFGVGLGNSIQKLFYLPEAHTDFVFAIWSEETGMFGAIAIIALYTFLFVCGIRIGRRAMQMEQFFASFIAYGMSLLFAFQAFINLGVNVGLLPTKGLTLPFISYGGSSLVACAIAVALILRVHHELEVQDEK